MTENEEAGLGLDLNREFEEILQKDFFKLSLEELRDIKLRFFKSAFEYHYNNCSNYKRLCDSNNITPEDINTYEDLGKIVAVPSDAFRKTNNPILSVPEESIVEILTSSGTTSNSPARFPYDSISSERYKKINARAWELAFEIDGNNPGTLFFIAPPVRENSPSLVRGGHASFKKLGFTDENMVFCIKEGNFNVEEMIEKMKSAKKPIILYGPPFGYLPIIELWENKGCKEPLIKLSENARVLTGGGWKGVKASISKKELEEKIAGVFGIDSSQVRDLFGASETMTSLSECKYHKKHVPPFIHISVRDPEDINKELEEGEEGMIVLMASWITSYPAFCLSGDMGYVKEEECDCGRNGQVVEITGRAKGAGARGCAMKLEEDLDREDEESSN